MTSDEIQWASWIGAGVSVVGAVVAFVFATRSQTAATQANLTQVGMLETSLRSEISIARAKIQELGLKVSEVRGGKQSDELTPEQREQLSHLNSTFDSAIEDYLNANEIACGMCIDGKIDAERFQKDYRDEIKKICTTDGRYAKLMQPEDQSKFRSIWRMYSDWYLAR